MITAALADVTDALVDTSLVTIYDPTSRPLSFLGLETVALVLAGLTLAHAVRAHRRGDRAAILTWLTIALYGLVMEIVSYNLVDNFIHGQFTVMFYDRQLPLYVTAIYPVMLYVGIATSRGLGLPLAVEPLAAGVLIVAMDAPFDVTGPIAGWWRWLDGHSEIAARWYGVPVTSYYWHFAFGGVLAALTSWAARRSRRPAGPSPWLVLPLSVLVIVVGVVAFLPFHGAVALGVPDGAFVAAALAAAALVAIAAPRRTPAVADRWLTAQWLVFYGYHAVVAASLAAASSDGWAPRAGFIALIAGTALAIRFAGAVRRPVLGVRAA
jgi:hypothetical protein